MKFRLKKGAGSVSGFTDAQGKKYLPGDIVELPATYEGERWLERVNEESEPVAAPSKIEQAPEIVPEAPLEEKKAKRKAK